MMAFEDFLIQKGYEVSSFIDPLLGRLVITINGENIISRELPNHAVYSKLLRMYHMSRNKLV